MSRYESEGEYSTRSYNAKGSDIKDGEAIAIRAESGPTIWMLSGTVEILDRNENWIAKIHPGDMWRWPHDGPQRRERVDPYQHNLGPPQSVLHGEQDRYDLTPGIADLGHIETDPGIEDRWRVDPPAAGEMLHLMLRVPEVTNGCVRRYNDCPHAEITHIVCKTIVEPDHLFNAVERDDKEDGEDSHSEAEA